MIRKAPYISRMALASLFLVFNVGLPILIDTCPMPRPVGSMMCPLCHDEGGKPGIEVVRGKPCCAPSLVAERNMNEFLTAQKTLSTHNVLPSVPIPAGVAQASITCLSQTFAPVPSQFAPDDIPVRYASLLI
jgi:hypothetical protein